MIFLITSCSLYENFNEVRILEKLTSEKLDVPEVTQSQEGQKQKLRIVLSAVNRVSLSFLKLFDIGT